MRLLIIITLIMVLWSVTSLASSNAFLNTNTYQVVYVQAGESVWTIAARYVTDKDDIRNLVMAMREVNHLNNNAQIYPGQELKIPVKNNR